MVEPHSVVSHTSSLQSSQFMSNQSPSAYGLKVIDTSYNRNHIICGLLGLAFVFYLSILFNFIYAGACIRFHFFLLQKYPPAI